MKKKLLAVFIAAMSTFVVKAQSIPAAWANRFQTVMDSLTNNMLTNNGDTIGVTMAVSVPGIGTWQGVAGPAVPGIPMTTNTTITIASNTKLYTAVIMLKLQEAGILSLDDHIGHWLHMPLNNVDTSATIRQCLQHETGLFDYVNDVADFWGPIFADVDAFWSYQQSIDSIGAPHFPKGHGYSYSNTNYLICGWIIEVATGQSYSHNLHQYITTPLGLTRTLDGATDTTEMNQNPASWSENYGIWYQPGGSTALASMTRGVGSIVSTPKDMTAFYQALFNPNSNFLSEASRKQLIAADPVSSYGLGVECAYSYWGQIPGYLHGGDVAGYHSITIYDRRTNGSIFWAVNSEDANLDVYYDALATAFLDYFPKQAADAGISAVNAPEGMSCNASVAPVVTLTNHGSAALTSATIGYRIDGGALSSYSWTGNLASGASTQVTLPVITSSQGRHSFKAWTSNPNGSPEGYSFNDTASNEFHSNLTTSYSGYFSENFDGATTPVLPWSAFYAIKDWGITKLAGKSGSHSLALNNFNNAMPGDLRYVDMPVVRLVSGSSPALHFSYAYNVTPGTADSLETLISADCGSTWTSLFYKGGKDLSEGDSTENRYTPQTAAEWRNVSIPLDAYSGDVLIRFRHVSGRGNVTYLDDISIGAPTGMAGIKTPEILVYPNPAKDQVIISGLPSGTTISLMDVTGKTLSETLITHNTTLIEISRLTPGVYLLHSPFGTRKIVKL